jgi:hypothetical protein
VSCGDVTNRAAPTCDVPETIGLALSTTLHAIEQHDRQGEHVNVSSARGTHQPGRLAAPDSECGC